MKFSTHKGSNLLILVKFEVQIHTENELISVLLVVKSLVNGTALGNAWSVKTENSGWNLCFFSQSLWEIWWRICWDHVCVPWIHTPDCWDQMMLMERPVTYFRDYKIFDRRLENSGTHVWLLLVLSLITLAGREGQDWWTAGFIYNLS